jgi:hypothetical protein
LVVAAEAAILIPVHLNELSPNEARATFPGFVYQLGNLLASANATIQAGIAAHYVVRHRGERRRVRSTAADPERGRQGGMKSRRAGPQKRPAVPLAPSDNRNNHIRARNGSESSAPSQAICRNSIAWTRRSAS